MKDDQTTRVLDQLLEPICRTFNPASASAFVEMEADPVVQGRVVVLAEKCNEGTLSPAEREEYESYVRAGTFISILQAEARLYLRNHSQS